MSENFWCQEHGQYQPTILTSACPKCAGRYLRANPTAPERLEDKFKIGDMDLLGAYAALEKERDELSATLEKEAFTPYALNRLKYYREEIKKLQADLAAEKERAAKLHRLCGERMTERDESREAYDTAKLAYAGLKEACEQALEERDTARAELKQTDERAQYWIAEAVRLRKALEQIAAIDGTYTDDGDNAQNLARKALNHK